MRRTARLAGRALLWGLVVLLASWGGALAQEAEGHAEGRIVAVDHELRVAVVRLASGDLVQAALGPALGDLPDVQAGERVELVFARGEDGARRYLVADWLRRPVLYALVGLFLIVAVGVARAKGLRAFVATAASLAITVGFVVPGIVAGQNPVVVSLLGVGTMLVLAIYFVHGVSWSTTAALAGTFVAVVVTMVLGLFFVDLARLTGISSHEAVFITVAAAQVDLKGMILAGLLIGALGALTDITIVQASVVRELAHVNPSFGLKELYGRAMNVGLDHIGSLVNTLVLAYTGAALPLLVLLQLQATTMSQALNLEAVAAEVVHTLVGSIGLILAVPVTTLIAACLFRGDRIPLKPGELEHAHAH